MSAAAVGADSFITRHVPLPEGRITQIRAQLAGGVAIITVGAATETAMKEKKPRVEDALNAGLEGSVIVEKVMAATAVAHGFDAESNEHGRHGPCRDHGSDEGGVRVALQNAASLASLLLTTEALITDTGADGHAAQAPGRRLL